MEVDRIKNIKRERMNEEENVRVKRVTKEMMVFYLRAGIFLVL